MSDSADKKGYEKAGEHLLVNRASGIFYVRKSFKRHGIPEIFQSTGETQVRKAKARAEELIQAHVAHHLGLKRGEHSVKAVIREILETVTPTKRPTTQQNHFIYFGELEKEWGHWRVNDVTLPAWANWLTGFRRRKKRKTFGDYAKHMNLLLRYAYKQRYCTHLLTLPNPDNREGKTGRVFSQDEIKALWTTMNEETRDQFVLCFECFMRLREALYLTWDRVDLENGVVTLRAQDVKTGSKTGKGRSFRLSPHALERLRARRLRIRSPYVFPAPGKADRPIHQNKSAWKHAKDKAGIRGRARWHDLRHTALTLSLLDRRMDPVLVSEYAGVSVRTIQQVYLHSTHEKTAAVADSVSVFASNSSEKEVI